jgi:L-alanine-DL-glutamate epimerase-like enolase superfamily enzyme
MKIAGVRSEALSIPMPPMGYYSGEGAGTKREWGRLSRITPHRPIPLLEYVIVTIETDEGSFGTGEATPDIGFFGETLEEVKSAIDLYLGPKLVGLDPFDRERMLHQLDFRGNHCARSALDLAVHDLLGKVLGIPVFDLLGGLCRERIPVALEIAGGPPDEMARACAGLVAQGVRAFKPKIGGKPDADADRLRAIREAVGRLAEKFDVGLELLEQPVPYWDLKGMAQVRQAVDILIEADESAFTVNDVMNIIRAEAADVINIKVEKLGGLYSAKKVAALAESAGLQCVIGTAFGLGVTVAAKLHLAASTMMIRDAVEFTELRLHENLLVAPLDSLLALPLTVPTGPGLGVAFDRTKTARWRAGIVD